MLDFSNLGNISNLVKQAKQFQDKFSGLDEKLKQIKIEAESGGGLVKVVMDCKNIVVSIKIDDSLLAVSEKATTQDLVTTAINNAQRKVSERIEEERTKIMSEMGLPPSLSGMF